MTHLKGFSYVVATVLLATVTLCAQFPVTGGSNYFSYSHTGCNDWTSYGVLKNYNSATTTINSQLQAMYNAGQRRLRIQVPFTHGGDSWSFDSTGGSIDPTNLENLLAEVKSIGFSEVLIAFWPTGANSPSTWSDQGVAFETTDDGGYLHWTDTDFEGRYQENWNVIANLRPYIVAADISYKIDLLNEGIPHSSEVKKLAYAQRQWADYNYVFGKDDTVGFSLIDEPDHDVLDMNDDVYGTSNPYGTYGGPYLFDVHVYGDDDHNNMNGGDGVTAYDLFSQADSILAAQGWTTEGFIVGEAYFNDATEPGDLADASAYTGRTIFYVTQWPLSRGSGCSTIDQYPPTSFSYYLGAGF